MQLEMAFLGLFTLATAVAMAVRWLKVPYTIALVLVGLLLGSMGQTPDTRPLVHSLKRSSVERSST